MKKQKLVVIGNGMVGQNFLQCMTESPARDRYDITVFCEEPRPAYDRVHLSEFFSGKTADDLSMVSHEFFMRNDISIHIGDKASRIDRKNKQVISAQGVSIAYDKLVLATGSYPFVPPRECAEAQSKDVGIITTEKGWNLYVCGNGGMKPRHADLFASDLDDDTLVKYIDRFYMFYIRTADKLQRTAAWMDNLEGGLEYLQEVIIDDTLGICDELEKEMAKVINTYQCEWKTTIEDPEKMKRFRHFVNSDKKDNNVVFVQERNQIRPATIKEQREYAKTA